MDQYFHSFTPEAMRALGEQIFASHRHRVDFVDRTRSYTLALLDTFRRQHREAAEHAAGARRLFVKDLRSGVHSLLGRFQLSRRVMAGELQSAREAWRKRPRFDLRGQGKRLESTAGAPFGE